MSNDERETYKGQKACFWDGTHIRYVNGNTCVACTDYKNKLKHKEMIQGVDNRNAMKKAHYESSL